jgi:hypothetical protein
VANVTFLHLGGHQRCAGKSVRAVTIPGIDLLAALAIVIAVIMVGHYLIVRPKPRQTSAFIVPSQSVRW